MPRNPHRIYEPTRYTTPVKVSQEDANLLSTTSGILLPRDGGRLNQFRSLIFTTRLDLCYRALVPSRLHWRVTKASILPAFTARTAPHFTIIGRGESGMPLSRSVLDLSTSSLVIHVIFSTLCYSAALLEQMMHGKPMRTKTMKQPRVVEPCYASCFFITANP